MGVLSVKLKEDNTGTFSLSSDFLKEGDALKAKGDTRSIHLDFEEMSHLNKESMSKASDAKQKVISNLSTLLKDPFKDFDKSVHVGMSFLDPKNWTGEKDYGNNAITSFAIITIISK